MIAQEQRPLAVVGNVRRLVEDLGERVAVLLPQRHEHARHQREVEGHVAFVAVAEVGAHVGGPLVRFGQQHPVAVGRVELPPHPLQHRVRLGQVLVVRSLADAQVRNRVETQRVDSEIEPELHHVDHGVDDGRIVVIEVGLVREEPMPVVLLRGVVPRPVRLFRVEEDDPRFGELLVGVAPDVELALRRSLRRATRPLKPGMLVGGVVDDELDEHLDVAIVRGADERLEVAQRAVARMHVPIVGDVVAVVLQRRGEKGEQPEAGDPEALQVVELLRQPVKVAAAVVVRVEERFDVRLVDDGVLVPERIVLRGRRRRRDCVDRNRQVRDFGSHRMCP